MTHTISFINMKGGVGKTTLTVQVAYALAIEHGYNVLLVDADPQFNASQYVMGTKEYLAHVEEYGTLLDVFVRRTTSVSTVTKKKTKRSPRASLSNLVWTAHDDDGRLDVIPSTLRMIELAMSPRGTERKLAHFLESATHYDFILIDCPPTVSIFTQAAILASDYYLVPVKPDPLSTIGLPLLERWLEDYVETQATALEPLGIVFCMVRANVDVALREEMREERGDDVFDPEISFSNVFSNAAKHRRPVIFAKRKRYANEVLAVTQEILDRLPADDDDV